MIIKKFFMVCLLFLINSSIYGKKLIYVDFYQSMSNHHLPSKFQENYKKNLQLLDFFRRIYMLHACRVGVRRAPTNKIPKIFHWIWVGDEPLPPYFAGFKKSFKRYHPDWECKVWTDKEISELIFINQDLYNQTINPGERSDIARIEILYQFGGVYVDTDVKCLGSFDVLHTLFDFYAGLGPITNHVGQINNGIIGARKGHPILKKYLELMPEAAHDWHVVYRTGPGLFTRAFKEAVKGDPLLVQTAIILPASYFSPLGKNQKVIGKEQKYIRPETFAIHYYYGTWTGRPGKVKKKKE